jgi:hypothetical protein
MELDPERCTRIVEVYNGKQFVESYQCKFKRKYDSLCWLHRRILETATIAAGSDKAYHHTHKGEIECSTDQKI